MLCAGFGGSCLVRGLNVFEIDVASWPKGHQGAPLSEGDKVVDARDIFGLFCFRGLVV